jgi:hypothetical protein
VDRPADLLYNPAGVTGYFPSFANDNRRIVAGSGGQLLIRDTDTGAEIERLPMPANTVGGSPDWSWINERIVAAVGPSGLENLLPDAGITSGSIMEWRGAPGGGWIGPEVIVARGNGPTLDRPAYSPEGTWIAYNQVGQSGGQGMGNLSTELWIVSAEGGAPLRLERANGGVRLGNSWPKWGPTDRRGRLWLAFSSLRDYGHVLQNTGRDSPTPQLWVTAIDPAAGPGIDPSAPAFWLPYQDTRSGNHIPYWAAYTKQ